MKRSPLNRLGKQGKWGSQERAENLRRSVLACNFCHDQAEILGEEKMQVIIQKAIANRGVTA